MVTNPDDKLARLRGVHHISGITDWAANEIERLRAALEIVTKDRDSLLTTFGSTPAQMADKLAKMRAPDEPAAEQPMPFVHVGNVFGKDAEGDVLVDWDSDTHEPKKGTLLFIRLYTQAELDDAHARTEERISRLIVDDGSAVSRTSEHG